MGHRDAQRHQVMDKRRSVTSQVKQRLHIDTMKLQTGLICLEPEQRCTQSS